MNGLDFAFYSAKHPAVLCAPVKPSCRRTLNSAVSSARAVIFPSFKRHLSILLAGILAGLGSGCETAKNYSLTYKLWDNGARSFCEPVANPELALSAVPFKGDFLVEYNAISDRHDGVRRLAYFLEANQQRINAGKAPHFVNSGRYRNLQAIPDSVSTNCYVISSEYGQAFTVYRPGCKPQSFKLPDYRDDHNTLVRTTLTPFAVAGDATVVGVAAAVLVAYACANGGETFR